MLKQLVGILVLLSAIGCVTWAHAATLSSDRNSEPDMKDYQVWICQTVNCVVVKSAATLHPTTIPQPAVGVRPSLVVDLMGKEGAFALSARDLSLNESVLSVQLPFDFKGPTAPLNPQLTP